MDSNSAPTPATQAVLDAFRSSHVGISCLSSALRTVAAQLSADTDIVDGMKYAGIWHSYDHLISIANELDKL